MVSAHCLPQLTRSLQQGTETWQLLRHLTAPCWGAANTHIPQVPTALSTPEGLPWITRSPWKAQLLIRLISSSGHLEGKKRTQIHNQNQQARSDRKKHINASPDPSPLPAIAPTHLGLRSCLLTHQTANAVSTTSCISHMQLQPLIASCSAAEASQIGSKDAVRTDLVAPAKALIFRD